MTNLNTNGLMETVKETKVAKKELTGREKLEVYLKDKKNIGMLETILPNGIDSVNFLAHIFLLIRKNEKLAQCTPESFLSAMLTVAETGIKPNTIAGEAYLIPYAKKMYDKQSKEWVITHYEAQLQLGYKGIMKIIRNSFPDIIINQGIVKQNDEFLIEQGTENKITHKYDWKERGQTVGYYATFKIPSSNQEGFAFMTTNEIEEHRKKHSTDVKNDDKNDNKKKTSWDTSYDEMAIKTVIKKALKYLTWNLDKREESTTLKALKNDENTVKNIQANEEDLIAETEIIDIDNLEEKPEGEVK